MPILSLPYEVKTVPPDRVQQTLDIIMEAGIPPTPEGRCIKRGCHGEVRRRYDPNEKLQGYILSPRCIECGTRYRLTPASMALALEPLIEIS